VLTVQQAREDLGYTAQQQSRMSDWDVENASDPQIVAANRGLANIANSGNG